MGGREGDRECGRQGVQCGSIKWSFMRMKAVKGRISLAIIGSQLESGGLWGRRGLRGCVWVDTRRVNAREHVSNAVSV